MSMNKNQVKGRVRIVTGKLREAAGKLVGNERLEARGKIQRALGYTQANFGDLTQHVKDASKKRS
jgi:uncharacterized protein YjbJ (UPF0337 family)